METKGRADLKFPGSKSALIGEGRDCHFVLWIEGETASRTSLLELFHHRGLGLDEKGISCTVHVSLAGCSMSDEVKGLAHLVQMELSVRARLQVEVPGGHPVDNVAAVCEGGHGAQQR